MAIPILPSCCMLVRLIAEIGIAILPRYVRATSQEVEEFVTNGNEKTGINICLADLEAAGLYTED